jgi:membrane carboxypeptidase/penicillin-binding protein
MKELSPLELAIASSLMAGAMQAAMIQSMVRNKVITDQEGQEIYEQALLMLETNQTASSSPVVFEAARELIERHFRRSVESKHAPSHRSQGRASHGRSKN